MATRTRPEPCDVGDHYACEKERPACTCTCHPRLGRNADSPNGYQPSTSNISAAHWTASRNGDDAA